MRIHKFGISCAGIFVVALLLAVATTIIHAAQQTEAANFVGTWQMTMEGGGRGPGGGGGNGAQGGGQGGGQDGGEARGGGQGRGGEQTLTIAQDGDKFKVTHKTPRGEETYDATVSGNTISWTETRQGRNGDTRTLDFKATLDGDSIKGTMNGGQFSREFTAKRSS